MNKLWKIVQYGYLIIAIICFIEGVLRFNTDRTKSYLFLGFSVFITLVFFIKRKLRKKVEDRNHSKQS